LVPKNTNFNVINCILYIVVLMLLPFTKVVAGYAKYSMEANSNKVFELRDFNEIDGKTNTYNVQSEQGLTIEILSFALINTNKRMPYRLVRFQVKAPDLWLPKTYYTNIQSKNELITKDYNVFVEVKLSRTRWLIYGLSVLLICTVLFGCIYYMFSK